MAFFGRHQKSEGGLIVRKTGTAEIMTEDRPSKYTKRERKILIHQIEVTQKRERELFAAKLKDPEEGLNAKVREKAPKKIMDKVQMALEKGFVLIFTKGTPAIEKIGGLKKKKIKAEINLESFDKGISLGAIGRVDSEAAGTAMTNKEITSVEGGIMGLFGWGPQDAPVFLGVIVKSIYEVAVSYGFDYSSNEEKRYIISLINAALAQPFDKITKSDECDKVGLEIDLGNGNNEDLSEDELQDAAEKIADEILVLKVLMMIKIVGTFSAATNFKLIKQVTEYAKVKYRQRFLLKLLMK